MYTDPLPELLLCEGALDGGGRQADRPTLDLLVVQQQVRRGDVVVRPLKTNIKFVWPKNKLLYDY